MTVRAAIYLRLSQDANSDGIGVSRQRTGCRALAADLDATTVTEFVDNDTSAYKRKPRPAFEDMLTRAGRGEFDVIVVWSVDRLYRRLTDLERLVDRLGQVQVRTVKSGRIDLSTADGRMVARLLGTIAQGESEKQAERRRAAAEHRARELRVTPTSTVPLGWMRDTDGALVPDPDTAPALHQAYADLAAGVSVRQTARTLSESTGRAVHPRSLHAIIRRPRNGGLASYKGEVTGPAADGRRIVSEELWRTVVDILADDQRKPPIGKPSNTLLGGGLLVCPRCGDRAMGRTRITRHGTRVPVYCCRERHVTRNRAPVEQVVVRLAAAVLARLKDEGLLQAHARAKADTAARERVAALDAQLEALSGLVSSLQLDPADYARAARRIRADLAQATTALVEQAAGPQAARLAASDDPARLLTDAADAGDHLLVRDVLSAILEAVVLPERRGGPLRMVWRSWLPGDLPTGVDL